MQHFIGKTFFLPIVGIDDNIAKKVEKNVAYSVEQSYYYYLSCDALVIKQQLNKHILLTPFKPELSRSFLNVRQ